jgi:hypothetical protein
VQINTNNVVIDGGASDSVKLVVEDFSVDDYCASEFAFVRITAEV